MSIPGVAGTRGGHSRTEGARPFIKWAGGKRQILDELLSRLPPGLEEGRITSYVEPFLGAGAMFFSLAQRYRLERVVLSDLNPDLLLVYRTIARDVESLISSLKELERRYEGLEGQERARMYYRVRERFNLERTERIDRNLAIRRSAMLIFLNRTCYNGLYRVNSQGEFNVPFGRYRRPCICDEANLHSVSRLLEGVELRVGDFTACEDAVSGGTFVYLDPPYHPLGGSSHFTSYSPGGFGEEDQRRLAGFFRRMDARGAALMLSNSDPRNRDPDDSFFEELYDGYWIERIRARRAISCMKEGRGEISELVITNYPLLHGAPARA